MKKGNVEKSWGHSAWTQHQPLKISQAIAFFLMSAMVAWAIPAHGSADLSMIEVDRNFNLVSRTSSKKGQRHLARKAWQALQRDLRGDALPATTRWRAKVRSFDADGATFRFQEYVHGIPVFGSDARVLIGSSTEVIRKHWAKTDFLSKTTAPNAGQVWWPTTKEDATRVLELATIKTLGQYREIRSVANNALIARLPTVAHLNEDATGIEAGAATSADFRCATQRPHPNPNGQVEFYVFSAATREASPLNARNGSPLDFDFDAYSYLQSKQDDDSSSASAREFMHDFSKYLDSRFQRKSYDGKASPMVAVVHAGRHYTGSGWVNDCGMAYFGDGDGVSILDTTQSYDSVAHEFSHGIIGSTSQLINVAESGSLNEAFSDVFAKLSSFRRTKSSRHYDWRFAPEILGPALSKQQPALRLLDDPIKTGGPTRIAATGKSPALLTCIANNDFCNVHKNSSVIALVLSRFVDEVDLDLAESVIYETFTKRLSALSDFKDFGEQFRAACKKRQCGDVAARALNTGGL